MFKNRNEGNIVYKCTVRLLEDVDVLECEFQPNHRGHFLLEYVCEQLDIHDRDYFGLRFVDSSKQRHWLDLSKLIIKQVKEVDPILFSFRVKFYPADPFRITGNGKFFLYQQLKRDLRHGRLYCSAGEAAALGALVVQEEIGDYDAELHQGDYVAGVRLVLRQTDQLNSKVIELHQRRERGQAPHTVIDEFMAIARDLETYGVDPHPVKDHRGTQLYLGINHCGINTFAAGRKAQHFRWPEIQKLNYEGKMFIAHLSYTDKESREPKKHMVGFKCPTGAACRYIWRCSIEQMLFFTLPNSQNASVVSGGGFMRGTKFRYSGRTEREILTENLNALRQQHLANNSSPSQRKANSVPATPSSPQGDLAEIRYSSLPRSTMSEPLGCTGQLTSGYCMENMPLLMENMEDVHRSNENGILSDYYFRDSFEHSSTESGFGHHQLRHELHHSANHQHQHPNASSTSEYAPLLNDMCEADQLGAAGSSSAQHHQHQLVDQQNASNKAKHAKRFSLLHAFVPSFVFVVATLVLSTVVVLESESEWWAPLRRQPEMVSLRYQYYQPLKEFIVKQFLSGNN